MPRGHIIQFFRLIDSVYEIGEACCARYVKELIERRHEVGCRTFSHVSL